RDGAGLVVVVGGVGLRVSAPASTLGKVGDVGAAVELRTHLYVREEILALYGFATEEELAAFELLISVSGVGPRNALGILSALSVEQLRSAIGRGNADLLTVVPGIGKRLASRIVLDLKDKVGPKGAAARGAEIAIPSGDAEVVEALTQVF